MSAQIGVLLLVLAFLAVLAFAVALAYRAGRSHWVGEGYKQGLRQGAFEAHRDALHAARADGRRFEVLFTDWGAQYGDMRWRWTIWDADRWLLLEVDPETGAKGIESPLMLGNAATKPMAEAEALAWLSVESANSLVLGLS